MLTLANCAGSAVYETGHRPPLFLRAATQMLTEFTGRIRLYQAWDRQLHAHTRFFGAAAHTNAALVQWCRMPRFIRATCDSGFEFLSTAGAYLETFNRKMAREIPRRPLQGVTLDDELVNIEQRSLEEFLVVHSKAHPARHRRVVAQLNRLLFWVGEISVSPLVSPSVHLYQRTLSELRQRLGRHVDFARMDDRIGIGQALVSLTRATPL
jgi:hypothetical protein